MKIELTRRHYGLHELVKEAEIPGELGDYATLAPMPRAYSDEYAVDEDMLLAALPEGFLPVSPSRVLLMVGDEDGATGQTGLSKFRNWAKYFDAYALTICKPEPAVRRRAIPLDQTPDMPEATQEVEDLRDGFARELDRFAGVITVEDGDDGQEPRRTRGR